MVTFTPHPNFGTCLQSYALSTVLKKMGHDVVFIYNNNDSLKRDFKGTIKYLIRTIIPHSLMEYYWRIKRRNNAKKNSSDTPTKGEITHYPPIIKVLPDARWAYLMSKVPLYTKLLRLFKYRTRQWKKIYSYTFKDGNYNMRRVFTLEQYEDIIKDSDIFITGSDQIWNPYCCGFDPFMFLEFVKGKKKCIAYSSSISRPSFPKEIEERVKNDLNQFRHIAVREQSSVLLLNTLLKRNDIQLVVDPTCLLSAEEWMIFGNKAKIEFTIPKKYIFCYFIGNRHSDYNEMVNKVKIKTGINNVITIDCTQSRINYGQGILYKDGGPYEFIYLLSHADFICMDSFHATIFALKFKKDFAHILKSQDDNTEYSQNERMYDLFTRYNLRSRLYDKNSEEWLKPIDWNDIEEISNKGIKDSMNYLINAIEN